VYASSLFAGGILSSLVAAAIPVIVLNRLGADQAADYYIVVSLTALLSVIASSTGLSLVAEGAHSQETLHEDVRKATLHIFSVLCPSILVYLVGGHYILSIFGRSYAQQGTALLRILALAAPFVALNYLADAIVNVRRQNGLFLIMCAFNSVLIICLSVLFVKRGLTGLGIAWLAAQALTVVVYGLVFRKELPAFVRGR
jgi:O-antigen/teichoic acid export membrane protein